MNNNIIERKW